LTESANTHLRASHEAQARSDFDGMLEAAERASEADGQDLRARFRLFECRLYCGQIDKVLSSLEDLEAAAHDDHRLLAQLAEFYTHCADHESALRCYQAAARLQWDNPEYLFALAAAEIAVGQLDSAESHLDGVIALNPHDYDAYRNRATLRRQTRDDNHIAEIEVLLAEGAKTPAGEAQLCYALAKEYEDLGEDERSFDYLRRGADKRRSIMSYDVDGDVAVMNRLREVFDAELIDSGARGYDEPGPVFVMGLPRSGTTLVDRILSSHSRVESLGEINNFAYSLMHTIGQGGDKLKLIDMSATIDFRELGERYVRSIRSFGKTSPFLIDKTPLNYLYVGLARLALPGARIVHIRRNPMDSCYGMYRTLFRAGYPFSYDFEDLGKYYVAYRRLMDHWRDVAPGAFIDVSYESLVDDQEEVSRQIVDYCGLEWEPACLEFHKNTSAVSTASSIQVRRPVYRDAMQRWRRYEKQLQPLADYLVDHGIALDAS
jgi:thioredoxin-like negative regulator of GroEL